MASELHQYAQGNIVFSDEGTTLRMWGQFTRSGTVEPIGLSFHHPDPWSEFTPNQGKQPRSPELECLATIADRINVPLIWFGENGINWRNFHGNLELGELTYNSDRNTFTNDIEKLTIADLEPALQDHFGTSLDADGTNKEENEQFSAFQQYTSQYLPSYVIQDFDAIGQSKPGEPTSIIEAKRTKQNPKDWTPFTKDAPNYYLQIQLASEANVEPLIVNHPQNPLKNELVGFYYDLSLPTSSYQSSNSEGFMSPERDIIPIEEALERIKTQTYTGDFSFSRVPEKQRPK